MIPCRIIRSVPEHTTAEVEHFWEIARNLHPHWEMVTYRDPIDPRLFPLTSSVWPLAKHGAQLAGLIRLEAVWSVGGIWCDSDVELFRSLDPLVELQAFAAWEDLNVVPDAVFGAEARHPAIKACLDLAIERIQSDSTDWRTGNGAWSTGPGVFTTILPGREDVTLLGPEAFYPVHYTAKETTRSFVPGADTYGIHHWAGSWL